MGTRPDRCDLLPMTKGYGRNCKGWGSWGTGIRPSTRQLTPKGVNSQFRPIRRFLMQMQTQRVIKLTQNWTYVMFLKKNQKSTISEHWSTRRLARPICDYDWKQRRVPWLLISYQLEANQRQWEITKIIPIFFYSHPQGNEFIDGFK